MAQIGFVLSHEQFPAPRLLEYGVTAERAGFDMLWTSDHFHPWQDNEGHAGQAWVTLAALGQRTEHVTLGTGVTCPSFRYRPTVVAQAFASLGVLYPGRVFLGVGSGEALNEQPASGAWGDYEERAGRLVEAVEIIHALFGGDWVDYAGEHFHVRQARLYDVPEQRVPVYIAAEGPHAMRLAGKHGDGLISDSKTATMPEMRKEFEAGARAAGKDPALLPVLAEHFVYIGGKEEAAAVAEKWRFLPNAWTEHVNDPDPRSIQRNAERETPIEKVLEMWTVSADPEEHIAALQKVLDGGVTHLFVHAGNEDQEAAIHFYGEQILPRLKADGQRRAA